jgi:hypothetical protein
LRVEKQSDHFMFLSKLRQPTTIYAASGIRKCERNGTLTSNALNDPARFDNFRFGIRQRQILEKSMAATVRSDRKAI